MDFCVLVGLPATSRGGKDRVAGEPIATGGRRSRASCRSTFARAVLAPPEIRAIVTFNHASYCSFLAQAARAGQAHRRLYVWLAPPAGSIRSLTLVGTPHTDAVKIRVGPKGVETKGVKHSMVCPQAADL